MKFRSMMTLSTIVLAVSAHSALAQTVTQDVTLAVQAVSKLAFSSAAPLSLVISNATAGAGLTAATATGSYAITSNDTTKKITAQIDQATPADVTLSVTLDAPTGGSSSIQALGTTAVDVVTGIGKVDQTGLSVLYTLAATVDAGVVAPTTRTVTYTLVAAP
jgi:hypothetical protein